MFKYVVLLGALAFAAPGLAVAAGNGPPSLSDLTANDPPADTFNVNGAGSVPPGFAIVPPACSVLQNDPDDQHHGSNGDDKPPALNNGNPHCQIRGASRR